MCHLPAEGAPGGLDAPLPAPAHSLWSPAGHVPWGRATAMSHCRPLRPCPATSPVSWPAPAPGCSLLLGLCPGPAPSARGAVHPGAVASPLRASGCCSGDWGPGHPQSHVAQCGKVGIWGVRCPAGLLRHPPCLPPPPGPGALAGPLVILPRPRAPTCVCEVGATVPARPPSGPWGGEHQCGTVGGPHPRLAFLPFPRSRMETAITLGTGGGRAGTCSPPL